MSGAAEAAEIISALAAVGAFGAAAVQLRGLRLDAMRTRAGEIAGVAVHTQVKTRPVAADAGPDLSRWEYAFVVHNPGRFPITEVRVEIRFDLPVIREHFDGSTDPASPTLEIIAPVIPAHETQSWRRVVLVQHSRHGQLRETVASVSFVAPDCGPRTNTWPDRGVRAKVDRRLVKELER